MNNFSKEMRLLRKISGKDYLKVSEINSVSPYAVDMAILQSDRAQFIRIFKCKLRELAQDLRELRDEYITIKKKCQTNDDLYFVMDSLKLHEGEILKEAQKFEQLIFELSPRNKNAIKKRMAMAQKISMAKSQSIIDVCSRLGIKIENSANFIKCPYHDEKTPSCKLYTKDNSFYSFCCCKGGDNITFVQAITKKTFTEALQFLVPEL